MYFSIIKTEKYTMALFTKRHEGIGKNKFNKIVNLFSSDDVDKKKQEEILGLSMNNDSNQNPNSTMSNSLHQPENASFKEKVNMWEAKIEDNTKKPEKLKSNGVDIVPRKKINVPLRKIKCKNYVENSSVSGEDTWENYIDDIYLMIQNSKKIKLHKINEDSAKNLPVLKVELITKKAKKDSDDIAL
jgi:hypothetical protein